MNKFVRSFPQLPAYYLLMYILLKHKRYNNTSSRNSIVNLIATSLWCLATFPPDWE